MKINEIIDRDRYLLDRMVSSEVATTVFDLYDQVDALSNNFVTPVSALYSPCLINEELNDLYYLKDICDEFTYDTQIPPFIAELISYFEDNRNS